jgi:hypothetical protein
MHVHLYVMYRYVNVNWCVYAHVYMYVYAWMVNVQRYLQFIWLGWDQKDIIHAHTQHTSTHTNVCVYVPILCRDHIYIQVYAYVCVCK